MNLLVGLIVLRVMLGLVDELLADRYADFELLNSVEKTSYGE